MVMHTPGSIYSISSSVSDSPRLHAPSLSGSYSGPHPLSGIPTYQQNGVYPQSYSMGPGYSRVNGGGQVFYAPPSSQGSLTQEQRARNKPPHRFQDKPPHRLQDGLVKKNEL